jgi:putative nucleotidyltransferase with HDIG domain
MENPGHSHESLLHQVQRLNWTLNVISRSNSVLVHAQDELSLYKGVCESITSEAGFPLAWVGIPRQDQQQSVEVFASAGSAVAYLEGIVVSWGPSPEGNGPSGRAIRSGQIQFNNNMLLSPQYLPWVERAKKYNLQSSFALPITLSTGEIVAALMVYSEVPDAFGDAELKLLGQLSADLGYGVESLRTRAAYEHALIENQKHTHEIAILLENSIEALAYTVELRDPYTAGHGKRVSELSVAIGKAMGLDEDRIHGLRLAAIVHDIGKIQVPAEILVKPGRLTDLEKRLVMEHPVAGYNILKQIAYPWPVAEAVWQHHERLDGSGYPRGLAGDEIILEARIIAVADIVEAMFSHRPYRPAMGLDAAFAEVQRLSPAQLDAKVVQTCLDLCSSGAVELKC